MTIPRFLWTIFIVFCYVGVLVAAWVILAPIGFWQMATMSVLSTVYLGVFGFLGFLLWFFVYSDVLKGPVWK
tara:strand:- start:203 stop:418 length:216 start_codon:yes stop_codon:yes gene_type:complete